MDTKVVHAELAKRFRSIIILKTWTNRCVSKRFGAKSVKSAKSAKRAKGRKRAKAQSRRDDGWDVVERRGGALRVGTGDGTLYGPRTWTMAGL
jgi:hypothetical protein